MKLKKIVSICLVGAMAATLLAGCGSSDETVGEEIKDDVEEVAEDVKDVAEEAAEDVKDVAEDVGEGVKDAVEDVGEDVKDAAEEAVEDVKENAGGGSSFEGFEETITIKGYGASPYGEAGAEEVIEAINEISIPAINVELDYSIMDMAAYSEQIGLIFAGGESFDLVMMLPVNSATFSVMLSKNELMDISGYLDEYAPELVDLVGPYLSAFEFDGGIYGVPGYKLFTGEYYVIMRKDILDYLGLTEQAEAISSWSDLEDIFEVIYDAEDSLPEDLQTTALVSNIGNFGAILPFTNCDVAADDFADHTGFDNLGDSFSMIYTDDEGNVYNLFATDDYLTTINRVRDWYEKGWVYKDAATNTDGILTMSYGGCFCVIEGSQYGVEQDKKRSTGYDTVCVNCCNFPNQTSNVVYMAWGVPVTSNEPEAAVAFLNLMFTNADIENLFCYGIEGRDYDLNEEGEAVIREDAVYQGGGDYLYGNQFLAYPIEGQGGDFREKALQIEQNGDLSPYYGFTINTDEIESEISAVYAVIMQYAPGLQSGAVDASETYDEFLEALDAAGMQTIVDYYQEKLDEWLAEQE